jgi:CRISPR-associated Csx11 family protein
MMDGGLSTMNLNNLENYKADILKCEIGTLLFNLGKTHVGFWKGFFPNETGDFTGYRDYYVEKYFEKEIKKYPELCCFIKSININFPFFSKNQVEWEDAFKGDISRENLFKNVFFRGCENINSGIDKGAPKKQLKSLWISNAFGSFKEKVDVKYFDRYRKNFFENLDNFLNEKGYYSRQFDLSHEDWRGLRNFVFKEIKEWYTHLLSDTRFPINDVTLWDQAYMSASMFKATLSSMILNNQDNENRLENPRYIKWSILGIQYDKLALAEKGLKPAHIEWYREASRQVDEAVKCFLENDYPLGNEIYRDETGIYFLIAEELKDNNNNINGLYKLNKDIKPKIEEKIIEIFEQTFKGEVYPAIFVTESSRRIGNLGYLIDEAKNNYLKSVKSENFEKLIINGYDNSPQGLCQVCGIRLANKKNDDYLICNVCKGRRDSKLNNWLSNRTNETIWTGEVQDKNGKIALVTLKFELNQWLNGNLFNSLLIRDENFIDTKNEIKNFISLFITGENLDTVFDTSEEDKSIDLINKEMENANKSHKKILGKNISQYKKVKENKEEIKNILNLLRDKRWWEKPLDEKYTFNGIREKDFETIFSNIRSKYVNKIKSIVPISVLDKISFFPKKFADEAYTGCKKAKESFDDFIDQISFNSLIGTDWEKLVKNSLSEGSFLANDRKIHWDKVNNEDLDYISNLLAQFMLRKNPSPARLKRTWDSTKIFFEEMESKILYLLNIPEERRKRLVWKNINLDDGEYYDGDIDFWVKDKNVYLITSIEKLENKKEFNLKSYNSNNTNSLTLKLENAKEEFYLPYFSIIDPTPISWQFAIPADKVPFLLENIEKEYFNNFRWVYGKLPLHVGIVVQNYKKPLYLAIKASRKIRRDGISWEKLRIIENGSSIKQRQNKALNCANLVEIDEGCKDYYSLFEKADGEGEYNFYLYFDTSKQAPLSYVGDSNDSDIFYIYPNTFDFEFLETNTRRNDIYYDEKGKRVIKEKLNRPYDLEDFKYFKMYKEFFDKKESGNSQKLISLIYSKLKDWPEDQESIKIFFLSTFTNVLDLKTEDEKNSFASILKFKDWKELSDSKPEDFVKRLYLLLDMFDFYHKALNLV